jgi:heme/copper-type cytochrome/quinol oxidase subunit 3
MSEESPLELPKRTTPTWEMELLISAASAFALLQLLSALADHYLRASVWLNEAHLNGFLVAIFLYSRIVVMCLAGAFVIHLSARAYWVSLIGLNSIYPEGPNHKKFSIGPFQRRAMEEYSANIPDKIEQADNRATKIFSAGVGMALIMVMPIILMLAVLSFTVLFAAFFDYPTAGRISTGIVLGPLVMLSVIPSLIDQMAGKRIKPDGTLGRMLSKSFSLINKLSLNTSGNALTMYLFTQSSNLRSAMVTSGLIGALLGAISLIDMPQIKKVESVAEAVTDLEASDYAAQRGNNLEYANRAHISAPLVTASMLDITIPIPAKAVPTDSAHCAQGDSEKKRLECLQKTIVLSINQKPQSVVWFKQNASEGRTSALRGMIDIRDLPKGHHVIQIDYAPNSKAPNEAWREMIHFWK